ncbi:hypothetical protein ABIB73_004008 [Bradyrhizobium sp. F1.4.3]|uniref:hypothetical protein n=1 Tax=Bradyrhizobium sp. F1.4.3 TaxID=3156356 RepID=UPI003396FD0D
MRLGIRRRSTFRAAASVTMLLGGMSRISQTFPPMVDPRRIVLQPMVIRPRIVSPT